MKKVLCITALTTFTSPVFAVDSAIVEDCMSAYTAQVPEAFERCIDPAEEGNYEAQKAIGDMYFWGWGEAVPRSYKDAVLWYKRAAIKGHTEAKYNLGVLYEQGRGVSTNYTKSVKWFMSAAEDGHAAAQFNLANMYSKGAGIEQNEIRATQWYLRAANQGDTNAQYNIGNRYAKGLGIGQDLAEAYKWYTLALENGGDEDAKQNRDFIIQNMTEEQIAEGKRRIKSWRPERER